MFLCLSINELTEAQNIHIKRNNLCNHVDTFLDTDQKFRKQFLECQTTKPCRLIKEDIEWHAINVLSRQYRGY